MILDFLLGWALVQSSRTDNRLKKQQKNRFLNIYAAIILLKSGLLEQFLLDLQYISHSMYWCYITG